MFIKALKDVVSGAMRQSPDALPESAGTTARGVPVLRHQRGGAIVAFVCPSEGDALKQHTMEMLAPFEGRCAQTIVLDTRDPGWLGGFEDAARRPIWFAMSPFGTAEFFNLGDDVATSPWAAAGIPFVRLFGDTPAYYPARHAQPLPNSINGYGHAEHHEFFVRWLQPKATSVWLPLYPFDCVPESAVGFQAKARSGTIIFPKNGNSPDELVAYWRSRLPGAVATILEAVAEEAVAALDATPDLATDLQRHFASLDVDIVGQRNLLFFLVAQLDDYLRRAKSTIIARALLDLPVTIRGINWGHVDFTGKRARHDPDSDYGRTRRLLDEATAIIDMSPNTSRGPHDRVLRAAGRHTAFLTNRSRFYSDNFADADTFTFRFDAASVRELVEDALECPSAVVERGAAQAARMRELLTRERYVEQVTAAVDACALACAPRPEGTQNYVALEPLP